METEPNQPDPYWHEIHGAHVIGWVVIKKLEDPERYILMCVEGGETRTVFPRFD